MDEVINSQWKICTSPGDFRHPVAFFALKLFYLNVVRVQNDGIQCISKGYTRDTCLIPRNRIVNHFPLVSWRYYYIHLHFTRTNATEMAQTSNFSSLTTSELMDGTINADTPEF